MTELSPRLKPCPFCEMSLCQNDYGGVTRYVHAFNDCVLDGLEFHEESDVKSWQTRTRKE